MNANKWMTIAVPSCWELQGFGKYDYGFAKDSVRGKEKGMYKYEFEVSPSWKNKVVNIVFEGVMTDAEVKVNGQSAGVIHKGAFYSFKYDISKLLKYDAKNLLEVTVAKHSANASVNEAERKGDYWIFGGIFRPVFLEALPQTHIKNVSINAKADGSFIAGVYTSEGQGDFNVKTKILDNKSVIVADVKTMNVNDNSFNNFLATGKITSPKLWSPESPNLYTAVFTIYKNGKALHTISQKFGFRTVEVKQRDGIYVNGVKVKMKGVNRHSFRPETGRAMSKQNSIEDVLLMKDMNMNAVRMSHYPPDGHFLDVCDSLGMFVMDELAGWHGHYDTPTGKKLVKEMLEHDRNHPSIIFWSNGNEGGHNLELDSLFSENDLQNRSVIHPWQNFGGFETQHYREYNYGIGNYENGHEILMPTEFLHGWFDGGQGAGLEDYWEKMWHNPLSAGGFLWDFADEGVVRKDKNDSLDTDKFHGADGILGPHFEKEGSYFAIKEIWSPIYFEKKEITNDWDGKLNIENRYFFTNTNECTFSYYFKKFGIGPLAFEKKGMMQSPNLKPSEKGQLKIELPKEWKNYDVLYVIVKDKYNREMVTKSYPLITPKKYSESFAANTGNLSLTQNDTSIEIANGNIEISINKKSGLLTKAKNTIGEIPFNNGPILCEGKADADSISYIKSADEIMVTCHYPKKSLIAALVWTIKAEGVLKMEIHYFPAAYFTNTVGVNFSFPESEMKGVEYMGNGPYRVWKNRMMGTKFGIWNKDYNNTETGEAPWIYPEFKGYYSNMYWCKFITKQQSFLVYTETEDLFLRLFTPAWKADQWRNYEPIFPSGDISFMQGIPAIGTKTQRNETTGPMGMKNIFYDYEKDSSRALKMVLYFDFGK